MTTELVPGSSVGWSEILGRRIRTDGLDTVGISSQTLAVGAIEAGSFQIGRDLGEYFHEEMTRINDILYLWLVDILAFGTEHQGLDLALAKQQAEAVVAALSPYRPGQGDLARFRQLCDQQQAESATASLELMRVRTAAVHDHLVFWIQGLLTDIAKRAGEDAVAEVVVRANATMWGPRYALWERMDPLERLQLSVEGMRGHLSGYGRRGDVGVVEESDRFVMVLDPCGSCGVLRRGDPDSGRPPCDPEGTTEPHAWARDRIGHGWYAVHSPIIMEWLPMQEGRPPMRPLTGCDSDGPCSWFIYKDPAAARLEPLDLAPPG